MNGGGTLKSEERDRNIPNKLIVMSICKGWCWRDTASMAERRGREEGRERKGEGAGEREREKERDEW